MCVYMGMFVHLVGYMRRVRAYVKVGGGEFECNLAKTMSKIDCMKAIQFKYTTLENKLW